MRAGPSDAGDHQLSKPRRSRVNRSQSSRADRGTIHGCPPFLVIILAQWMAHSRRRIAGGRNCVPDCNDRCRILHPGRSLSFVQILTTLLIKRRSAVSGSWCRTADSFYSSSEPSIAGLRVQQMRLCARKARHRDVGEVIVFAIISDPSELVIKDRSLRRQSVAALVCLVDALTLLLLVGLCRHYVCSNCRTNRA